MLPDKIKSLLFVALACLVTLVGCSDEDAVVMESQMQSPGLYVSLTLAGETPVVAPPVTRGDVIEGEDAQGENTVESVDFFLFNTSGQRVIAPVSCAPTGSNTETSENAADTNILGDKVQYYVSTPECQLFRGTQWIDSEAGVKEGYKLYALANVNWDSASIAKTNIRTVEDLQRLIVKDRMIYQRTGSAKRFLMDGCYTFTEADITRYQNATTTVHTVTVDVYRAAAKVKVNIYKNTSWAGYAFAKVGDITVGLQNYADSTKAVAEAPMWTPAGGLHDVSHNAATNLRITPYYGKTDDDYLGSVIFYTFANDWSSQSSRETSLELNIPYDNDVNDDEYTRPRNYYKIVFQPDDGGVINRNTFYEVDIRVNNDGATVSEEPVEVSSKWIVKAWKQEKFDVVESTNVDYLILSDYFIDMRNEDQTSITFYSSDKVKVEVVGFAAESGLNEVLNANQPDITIKNSLMNAGFISSTNAEKIGYDGHKRVADGYKEIPGVYYVNKDNERIDITNDPNPTARAYYGTNPVYGDATGEAGGYATGSKPALSTMEGYEVYVTYPNDVIGRDNGNGVITIYSRIPQNVTPRYITLKVTMPTRQTGTDSNPVTLTRYAVIKQYPLEYIEGVEGFYSYMDTTVMHHKDSTKVLAYNLPVPVDEIDGGYQGGTYNVENAPFTITLPTPFQVGLNGHVGNFTNMKPKFYIPYETETDPIFGIDWSDWNDDDFSYAVWGNVEGMHYGRIYALDDSYANTAEGVVGVVDNGAANNNRMYKVVVTATSTRYRISYPETVLLEEDEDYTPKKLSDFPAAAKIRKVYDSRRVLKDDPDNNNLLSPCFMLASQLGNNSAVYYWDVARDQCKKYVEVGRDGNLYADWRLPTSAELEIIKRYQLDENVYDITMNKVLNAEGDSYHRYYTGQRNVYVETTGAGGLGSILEGAWKSNDEATRESNRVRVRCVRDVKE